MPTEMAHNADCEQGALTLKKAIEKSDLTTHCHFQPPLTVHNRKQQADALNDIATLSNTLAQSTQQSLLNNHFFLTLGGDHTAAIGSWSGAAHVINNLGLIWFDAHMDSHTVETTQSNNIHGMPLAILLGHGEKKLTTILSNQPKLKPDNVVLIGVRSYESGETALLKKLGVKIFFMEDIKTQGMKAVISESIKTVTQNTDAFGISIDLDGFDPIDAPGVGTAEKNGVRAAIFLSEFSAITTHPKLIGMDIVEFNPTLDVNHKTEKLTLKLIRCLISNNAIKN